MAIIVKKDIGIGQIFDAYLNLEIGWSSAEGGRWEINSTYWASKEARELSVIQKWIDYRLADVSVSIPFDENYSQKWGISQEDWDTQTKLGPWDKAEDLDYIKEKYIDRGIQPVQVFSTFFYDREKPKGLPTSLDLNKVKKHFYKSIKDEESPLFGILMSTGLTRQDVKKTVRDDLETKKAMILRVAKEEPLLTVLAPSESVLMWPDGWE